MKLIRDSSSSAVIDQTPVPFDPQRVAGHRHILLVTTRRNGQRIAAPIWFAADPTGRLVLRSGAGDPKVSRIRRNSSITFAACSPRGRPLGQPMHARARILEPQEEPDAERLLNGAIGWQRKLYNLVRAPFLRMTYIELAPTLPATRPTNDDSERRRPK